MQQQLTFNLFVVLVPKEPRTSIANVGLLTLDPGIYPICFDVAQGVKASIHLLSLLLTFFTGNALENRPM